MKINSIKYIKYSLLGLLFFSFSVFSQNNTKTTYASTYESLKNYSTPEWYEDSKIGFWVCWGVYSVPAFSGDHAAEWYGRWLYANEVNGEKRGLATHNHHEQKYGDPSVFGYKDFIPMFKAERYDPNEWADLFVKGGAKFFCMMGVFSDNFAMWNSKLSRFNAVQMGPKRDLLGEIGKSVRARGLKFGVSNHSGWNSGFYEYNFLNKYDAIDTTYQDLYGRPNIVDNKVSPSDRDLNRWLARTKELCDMYKPDLYYFDWDINPEVFESRRIEFAAHFYNKAVEWGNGKFGAPGVVLNYKKKAFPLGSAVLDHERGREDSIPRLVWQTDDSVYDGDNWGYAENSPVKSPNTIVDELVDIVSKRGILMLCFAPRPDGTFPDDQKQLMLSIGNWLKICGEAIYSTRPWLVYGEGPVYLNKSKSRKLASEDIRFTRNKANNTLYAILMDWPQNDIVIKSLGESNAPKNSIKSISIVGLKEKISWKQGANGITIKLPKTKPAYDYAFPVKIVFKAECPKTN